MAESTTPILPIKSQAHKRAIRSLYTWLRGILGPYLPPEGPFLIRRCSLSSPLSSITVYGNAKHLFASQGIKVHWAT